MTKHTDNTRLRLAPPGSRSGFWLFVLIMLLPLTITIAAMTLAALSDGKKNLLGNSMTLTFVVVVFGMAALCGVLWWVLSWAMRRQSLTLTASTLEMRSTFYRCVMPLKEMKLEQVRVVDLDEHTELKPLVKINGFSMPGFNSGWFLLRNKRRAFVATSDGRHKLWLPSKGKHDLLIEPTDATALLTRLQESSRE
jgi:hypothetical protein